MSAGTGRDDADQSGTLVSPLREESALGVPKPETSIERVCARCGASFLGLAPGKTGLRGWWKDWTWFCSAECRDGKTARMKALKRVLR